MNTDKRERKREYYKEHYLKNREVYLMRAKKWMQDNPDAYRENHNNYQKKIRQEKNNEKFAPMYSLLEEILKITSPKDFRPEYNFDQHKAHRVTRGVKTELMNKLNQFGFLTTNQMAEKEGVTTQAISYRSIHGNEYYTVRVNKVLRLLKK